MPSFDVVSKVDMQEVDNAVNQAKKEINTRYDFKGSKSKIEFDRVGITLIADDKMKLSALQEILKLKLVKRGVGVKAMVFNEPEQAFGDLLRQKIDIQQGISQDDARKMVKLLKEQKLKKVQAQIQADQLRVTGPKRDDLQQVISLYKEKMSNLELQFVNYRD